MNHKAHRDSIYSSVSPHRVGWYTTHLEPSRPSSALKGLGGMILLFSYF